MPRWLPAAIVVAPLLRFEGLALSLAALLVLLLRGRWRAALGSLAAIGLCMGLFSVFLIHIGMPPLPSSVLAKSEVAANGINGAGGGFFQSISENVSTMAHIPSGALLLLIGAIALARCLGEALGLRSRVAAIMNWLPRRLRNTRFFRLFAGPDAEDHDPSTIFDAQPRRWSSQGLMALLLACFIAAHAVAGQFGWLDRYEDYVLLGSALISIYLLRKAIRYVLLNRSARVVLPGAIAIILAMICYRYIRVTWRVPLASNNIYEQQFQMHRFVNDYYRGPVAVNDLGLVSYHNPNFVLDLGGLASERARILKAGDASAEDYRTLVADSGVHLVIIYEEWFPGQIPASWIKVASMNLSREHVSCALSEVQFYATDAFTASQLQPELESFRKSLPPGVKLTIHIGRGPGN
jgi:hypothetical protein